MSTETEIIPDGVWRPEEWKNGRYLVVRHVTVPCGTTDDEGNPTHIFKREIHCASKFGGDALIFESEESAEAEATRLNEQAEEEPDQDPPQGE